MNISAISNTNFNGVRLKTASFENSCFVNDILRYNNIDVLGYKKYFVSNTLDSKQKTANYVRRCNHFSNNECGVLLLPWSNETWILGKPILEQRIQKILNRFSIDSDINFSI